MYKIRTLEIIITLWLEMNANVFKSPLMIPMTGLQVEGREQRGKE
jgi:hypothetical protein